MHVNGYIFNSASATSTLPATLSSSTPGITSTISPETVQKEVNDTISTGAVVGIAVGAVVVGFVLSCIVSWFVLRRYRRKYFQHPQRSVWPSNHAQPVSMKSPDPARSEIQTVEMAQELSGHHNVQELSESHISRL